MQDIAVYPFTRLERALLDWIARRTSDLALAAQCTSARAMEREYTGSGFFVNLTVPEEVPAISHFDYALHDPVIESPDLPAGGGMVLFCEAGRLSLLEIYSFGGLSP